MSAKIKQTRFTLISERCKGCGFCIEFCPQHILIKDSQTNSKGYHLVSLVDKDKCTGCNLCGMVCPDFAVNVTLIKPEPEKEEP